MNKVLESGGWPNTGSNELWFRARLLTFWSWLDLPVWCNDLSWCILLLSFWYRRHHMSLPPPPSLQEQHNYQLFPLWLGQGSYPAAAPHGAFRSGHLFWPCKELDPFAQWLCHVPSLALCGRCGPTHAGRWRKALRCCCSTGGISCRPPSWHPA